MVKRNTYMYENIIQPRGERTYKNGALTVVKCIMHGKELPSALLEMLTSQWRHDPSYYDYVAVYGTNFKRQNEKK